MASKFDPRRLQHRRFEVQVHYHAAYMYWALRGALAERWGHGPHFGAYSATEDELRLTRASTEGPTELVAVVGLKRSLFIAENESVELGFELAQSWLGDVNETLKPRVVNRIIVRNLYAYPAVDPSAVSLALMKDFPSIADFVPEGMGARHGGLQYQTIDEEPDRVVRRTATFGVYGPSQQSEYFLAPNDSWEIGFHHTTEWLSAENITDRPKVLGDDVPKATGWAGQQALREIARVMSHA